jgi:glyoxylase-like metal-dependent hydrolase (beta-lactamase superfamily II)
MVRLDLLIPGLSAKADHFLFGICTLVLLRDGRRTILFDAGAYRVRGALVAALKSHGLAPDDIDVVYMSHLHWDHVENVDLFRNADIYVSRKEYDYTAAIAPGDWGTPPFVRDILAGLRLVLLDEREEEIFPGMRTISLPGHSIGLQGLVVETEHGKAVLAADALWSARDAVRGKPDLAFYDFDQGLASLTRLLKAGSIFYPGHDRPFRFENGHVTYLAQSAYRLRMGFAPDGDDVEYAFSTHGGADLTGGLLPETKGA